MHPHETAMCPAKISTPPPPIALQSFLPAVQSHSIAPQSPPIAFQSFLLRPSIVLNRLSIVSPRNQIASYQYQIASPRLCLAAKELQPHLSTQKMRLFTMKKPSFIHKVQATMVRKASFHQQQSSKQRKIRHLMIK